MHPPLSDPRSAGPAGPSPTPTELLHAASRTFAIGIDRLPSPLREQIEAAYLLLRVSDYLEDNREMGVGRKAELLEGWARVVEGQQALEPLAEELEGAGVDRSGVVGADGADGAADTPDALVARHVRRVVEAFRSLAPAPRDVIARHVADSTRGMARWALRGPNIADEADLDDYMHEVAGRVGWLLTDLFALRIGRIEGHRERMRALAREFGLALQTVNVIRGLHEDRERGWNYIPRAYLGGGAGGDAGGRAGGGAGGGVRGGGDTAAGGAGAGVRPDDGARPSPAELAALGRLVEKADRHLAAARRYLHGIPRRHHRVRLFCLLPLLFAVRTLAISRDNPRVFVEETKIGRDEVRRIVRAARLFGWSNAWIGWYCRRLERV